MSTIAERIASLSPEKLALLEQRLKPGGEAPRAATLPRRGPADPSPLSFAQERLWFLDQLNPGSPAYNLPLAIPLTGRLDVAALTWALREIVRRHEALRTTFVPRRGEPEQVVADAAVVEVTMLDRSGLPAAERATAATRLAAAEHERRFDLAAGPLLSATLVRLDADEHLLLVTIHHIVADGWSLTIFLRELEALYAARCANQPSPLPELPLQYADFALWQRRSLQGEALAPALQHWRQQLHGAPALLELPTDRPRPAVQTSRGAFLSFDLPAELTDDLAALGRSLSVPLFVVLLATAKLLFQRWSGQDDIVVGTPVANRGRTEIEGLIGFFVNMLVLRTDLSGSPSFAAVVRRLHEVALAAYTFQDLPFEKLVEELRPERSLSHQPLFQVTFTLQNTPPGGSLRGAGAAGAAARPRFAPQPVGASAKFDLTIGLTATAAGLAGAVEYNTDLFDPATIRRLAGQYRALLRQAVVNPEGPACRLPLLGERERHQLLVEWNDTEARLDAGSCLHELLAAQAARRPGAPAVWFDGRRLTYGELEAGANRLARSLIRLGVGPEVVVGVAMERSLEMVVALLAILKAGGAYLPLDPAFPGERLALILAEAGSPVLLTQQRLAARLPESDRRVLCVDALWRDLEREPAAAPASRAAADNLAYVIYTSGSTGRPKGSMISHRAIVNRLLWMQRSYALAEDDRVLQKTPYGFDVSVWEFFWPLAAGACLVVARPEGHRDPAYLVELINAQRITVLHFVPAMLQAFLEQDGAGTCISLRRVVASGEALPAEVAARFHERLGAELDNLYGPTEAAVDVTAWACRRGAAGHSIPIGRPISNLRIVLVDRSGDLVPAGVAGELCIGGVGLARGYLANPAQTAERFVPDPRAASPGERLYRTGDLARLLPDGTIDFLGRFDHQVKVRGHRIELGEIEAALLAQAGVREAAVVLHRTAPGDSRLIAFVAGGADAAAPAAEELRRSLAAQLPEYMVPWAFVALPSLPLTRSGKVDRLALPALMPSVRPAERRGVPPRNDLEESVAASWREVLKLDSVGVHDSFFDLGGHSLLATQVLSRLRDRYGVKLPLSLFFEQPTVAGLASLLEQRGSTQPLRDAPPPPPPASPAASPPRHQSAPAAPAGLAGEWLFHQAHADYRSSIELAWAEVQRRGLELRLSLLEGAGAEQDEMAPALAQVWEEGQERLESEFRRYLAALQRAWRSLDGSVVEPAALARIAESLAAGAWCAATTVALRPEVRPDDRRRAAPPVAARDVRREAPSAGRPPARRVPEPAEPEAPAEPASRPRTVPLSFSQERLWFLDQLEPGSPLYNIPNALPLTGRVDAGAIERALCEVVRRHEVLRSTVQLEGDRPVQVIHPELPVRLEVLDLRTMAPAGRRAEAERLAQEDAALPFDLASGPLLRAALVRLADDESVLMLTVHHIVADGWSLGILFSELAALYQAFSAGRPSPLPPLVCQYADFVLWQRQRLDGAELASLLDYWRAQLAGAPPQLRLPTDRPRPQDQTFRGALAFFDLPAPLLTGLERLSQRCGATLFMSLLAAYAILLYRYTGAEDLVIGAPIANRNRAELEGLIGFFVNTLVLRTRLSGDLSYSELLARIGEVTLEAYDHQDLPFEKLVEELAPERTLGYTPLCQVVFNLQNSPTWGALGGDAPRLVPHSGTAKFDLNLTMATSAQGLLGAFEYNTDLFDESTILRMRDHLAAILAAVVANPAVRILDIQLTPSEERAGWDTARVPAGGGADELESFAF